jgi:DNA-binding HxlR family transcriptional regulator
MVGYPRRAEAAMAYNAFLASCPTRQLLDALIDKWLTLVLAALADAGRTVTPSVPVRVDYPMTPLGTDLMRSVAQAA